MLDGHIHYCEAMGADRLNQVIRAQQLDGVALQCIPKDGRMTEPDALAFAAQAEVPVYVFGGIDRGVYQLRGRAMTDGLMRGLDRLDGLGCTGLKMLEGKPDVRFHHPMPDFDSDAWAPFWQRLEQEQRPVVMHLCDPAEFWDEQRITPYAREAGWFYDSCYPAREALYGQMHAVLEKHPALRILFPHMLFFGGELARLDRVLTAYPNVYTDTTPALEQLIALGQHPQEARAFFVKWQTRICYGTDIGSRQIVPKEPLPLNLEESCTRALCVRQLLTEAGPYDIMPGGSFVREPAPVPMRGLALEPDVLHRIQGENFRCFTGV